MNDNQLVTRELIELKSKIMIQKIDKLYSICNMLFENSETTEGKSLEIIKEQYFQMYNKLLDTEQYQKYKEVEDIIVKEIAKIELNIDKYVFDTVQNYEEIIQYNIEKVYLSKNYQEFNNLDQEISHMETLKELFRLYSPYVSKNEMKRLQEEIIELKFDLLYRKQVEQLIYENGGDKSNLTQYDNETEKLAFEKLLAKKLNSAKNKSVDQAEENKEDDLFKMPIEQILNNSQLLERLIIIDMKRNSYAYINLLKAKIFNAHLCNIGNNPFKKEIYITGKGIRMLGYWQYESGFKGLEADKVNYSLLQAILESIITTENVSYIDCENLYRRFGFECKPILINIGQECVKIILDGVRGSKEYKNILNKSEKKEDSSEERYCKIDFRGLIYEFEDEDEDPEKLFNKVISERNIESSSSKKRKKIFSKDNEIDKKETTLQEKKEKIKAEGNMTTDIDVIIALEKDVIEKYYAELDELMKKLEQESQIDKEEISFSFLFESRKFDAEKCEEKIREEQANIEWLEDLKEKNGKLTLKDARMFLVLIRSVYDKSQIKYNERNILPLEYMTRWSNQVSFAPIPQESGYESVEVRHSFLYGSEYEKRYYHRSEIKPLWKKYKEECRDLAIDAKMYKRYYSDNPHFAICVNLDDISDLPIDYEKVELVTKDELKVIREREEGNER